MFLFDHGNKGTKVLIVLQRVINDEAKMAETMVTTVYVYVYVSKIMFARRPAPFLCRDSHYND